MKGQKHPEECCSLQNCSDFQNASHDVDNVVVDDDVDDVGADDEVTSTSSSSGSVLDDTHKNRVVT